MGLLKIVFTIVAFFVLALVGLGAYLYFTDYEAKAEVTSKDRDEGGDFVIIKAEIFGYELKQYISSETANFVCVGYDVAYRVQTGNYKVFDATGDLVYDSQQGLVNQREALRCATANSGSGGGLLGIG